MVDNMTSKEINTGNKQLDLKISEWLKWDQNEETKLELYNLIKDKKFEILEKKLLHRVKFGTAGIRGRMEFGFDSLNDLVIIQTTQGLLKYLMKTFEKIKNMGCVIGFDARYNSKRWAERAASIFLHQGIPVFLFSDICPTPFISYSVVNLKCCCGIMITASHNPKNDNGYKVFWINGAQITEPHDVGIQNSIEENLVPWSNSWTVEILQKNDYLKDPLPLISKSYLEYLKHSLVYSKLASESKLKICFTPMHGVSQKYMVDAFSYCQFPSFVSVPSQKDPNPDFPTVAFPNPEEAGALNEALAIANNEKCTLLLANDPDADRMSVAEKMSNGNWKIFTGNEIGALLGYWLWHCYSVTKENLEKEKVYMISSAVSSRILFSIAEKEGFNSMETLTGFKWMANMADKLEREGNKVLFAFEEAIGFMCGTHVLDKDGIMASIRLTELAIFLEAENKSLSMKLEDIYMQYGYHTSRNSYFLCYEPEVLVKIFNRLRNFNESLTSCGPYIIINVRDLTTGYDSREANNCSTLPVSVSSQMITFYFQNGAIATLRTSGTEPKLKYYTEMCVQAPPSDWKMYDEKLEDLVQNMITYFLEPEKNSLLSRPDE